MNVDFIKGTPVTVTYGDNLTIRGTFVSVNSKGVNVKTTEGKIKSVAVSRITDIQDNTPRSVEGLTTSEVADMLNMAAKELRVHLRAMGMGVGKGRRYGFNAEDVTTIRQHLANA